MKTELFDYLYELMGKNNDLYILFVGLGFPRFEEFREMYPDRVINTEAAEQSALDIAVGLSYAGKTPVIYTITPFLLRGFETIRTYINHESLPVVLVGAGRDDDYSKHDGYSHDAKDIFSIMRTQRNIRQYYPHSVDELQGALHLATEGKQPSFISVPR
jgi:transketolase